VASDLPLQGAHVSQVRVDHAVTLVFLRGTFSASLRLEVDFDLSDGDQHLLFSGERRSLLGPVLWELAASDGTLVVCSPGGGAVKWSAPHPSEG
jgi:hypothetical protein